MPVETGETTCWCADAYLLSEIDWEPAAAGAPTLTVMACVGCGDVHRHVTFPSASPFRCWPCTERWLDQ